MKLKIENEEVIDRSTFLTIFNNKVVIKKDPSRQYDDFIKNFLFAYSPILIIFLILSFFSLSGLSLFIQFTLCPLPIFTVYLYYRYRKYEWVFDKSLKKAHLQRVSPSFKRKRFYDLSKIDSISYQLGNYFFGPLYDVKIILKYKKKGKKIYVGEKEKSERVGELIARFLEKPLNHDDSKELKIY